MNPGQQADLKLVHKAKAGSKDAFGLLVNKYQQKVFYLAYDLVGDYDDAKDIAQNAFIRAYERLSMFQERAKFSTWLYRITVNMAMDEHRRRKRHPHDTLETHIRTIEQDAAEKDNNEPDPDSGERQKLRQALINKGLGTLSKNQRTAVVLKYFHQKSSKEIGDILGCSESTARIHIFRGLKNLQRSFKFKDDLL